MQDVDKFIDDLIRERGTASPDQEVMAIVKADMKSILLDQIDKEAVMRLNDDQIGELADLTDSPNFSRTDFLEFLQRAGVNMDDVVEATKQQFCEFYLNAPKEEQ